jgi:hypothetical protein
MLSNGKLTAALVHPKWCTPVLIPQDPLNRRSGRHANVSTRKRLEFTPGTAASIRTRTLANYAPTHSGNAAKLEMIYFRL